jgi:hypothetical protein
MYQIVTYYCHRKKSYYFKNDKGETIVITVSKGHKLNVGKRGSIFYLLMEY